jgi:hypothetical protein
MKTALRRLFAATILGLSLVGAAANVAQAASALDHACCHRAPAESSAAADSPCHGFLPLTCCRSAALPGGDHAATQPPNAVALLGVAMLAAPAAIVASRPASAVLGPRMAPTRLSVVLLI